ncbi:MAG: hypothetical protein ACK2UK_10900 [Candidatus Promineifilaceae bacterium]
MTRVVEVPGQEVEVTVEVPGPEVEVTRVVEVMLEPATAVDVVPFEDQWLASAHANAEAEAFVHWNEDDPAEVPTSCAKCHSTPGFLDFVGADGTEFGVVDNPAPIGTTITCEACHNEGTINMTSVVMPSGLELTGLGPEARCMQCHQGRESTVSVNNSIEEAGLTDSPDEISEDLGFSNIHYYAAAATQFGTLAKGGYEYDGKMYDGRFNHVEGYDTCNSCHNPHTLEVQVEECTVCHTDVTTVDDFVNVRMQGSLVDYDGDGDMEEGIYFEIEGLRDMLFQAMQSYANEVTGTPIGYNAESHPYFFIDGDGDGVISEEEAVRDNAYNAWSPRLAKAAYNYQVSLKDPGRYAHGGKYIIELLYDSIEDVNQALSEPVDLSTARRIDHGHFAGSEEAFRHWDEEGMVPGSCSKCHSAAGLPLFVEQGVSIAQPVSNGLMCATCHNNVDEGEFTIYEVEQVRFPSGATLTLEDPTSNLCINCHQGRESTVSVNNAIGDSPDDEVAEGLGFRNVHYFAAGATLFGNEAQGAYQYEGQEYVGRNEHVPAFDTCTECHSIHELEVEVAACANCHDGVESKEDLATIRVSEVDYDGDGDIEEGIAGEVATMTDALMVAIQGYAADNPATESIVYSSASYPYFFIDTNGDGVADPDEINGGNGYPTWTPRLLRAAYNYQYAQKDPGAFAHNGAYVLQVLYDSIADMGGDVTGMTRPAVPAE